MVVEIRTDLKLLAHHQIHVLIYTTTRFNAPKFVSTIMVMKKLAYLTALMLLEHQSFVQYNKCFVTNFIHALIHQIQSGVNSTYPINY